jgi:hypothetical protein
MVDPFSYFFFASTRLLSIKNLFNSKNSYPALSYHNKLGTKIQYHTRYVSNRKGLLCSLKDCNLQNYLNSHSLLYMERNVSTLKIILFYIQSLYYSTYHIYIWRSSGLVYSQCQPDRLDAIRRWQWLISLLLLYLYIYGNKR